MTVKRRGAHQKQYSFQYYCSKAFIYSYFEEGCQKCARATIPEGWDMMNTLYAVSDTVAVESSIDASL